MICLNCKTETLAQKTIITHGKLLEGCDNCLSDLMQQQAPGAAKYHRDRDREDYRKDITQPNQGRDFIRAYGVEKSRKYMTDETIRKLV